MRLGIVTCGGDCPGLNAVIRAVVRRAAQRGASVIGFEDGFQGFVEDRTMELTLDNTIHILERGGSILGCSGYNPFLDEQTAELTMATAQRHGLDRLIVVGGNSSMGIAMNAQERGLPVVGIPKTIDNDVAGTDITVGFDTAVQTATEAIDRLRTTAESHDRVMIVETMGRDYGWITIAAGLAGGADIVLPPEKLISVHDVAGAIRADRERGQMFTIIVIGEGAMFEGEEKPIGHQRTGIEPFFQLGGVGQELANRLLAEHAYEYRVSVSVIGHLQRGGSPTASDRILAIKFGVRGTDLAIDGPQGNMVAMIDNQLVLTPLTEVAGHLKPVDPRLMETAGTFFGGIADRPDRPMPGQAGLQLRP